MGDFRGGLRTPGVMLLALVLAVGAGGRGAAQASSRTSQPPAPTDAAQNQDASLDAWLAAVNAHVPGKADAAVARLAPWSRADLDAVLAQLKKQTPPQDLNRLLERGAILHGDVAMSAPRHLSDSGAALFNDGHIIGHVAGTVHWDFGRALLDNVTPSPAADDRVRLWYRATAAALQQTGDYSDLEPHLLRALQIFPDDPVLLLDAGTIREAYAGPRIQSVLARMDAASSAVTGYDLPTAARGFATAVASGVRPVAKDAAASEVRTEPSSDVQMNLTVAEGLFRRALQNDPTLGEAHIRLAHVLGARGDHEGAIAELDRARALPLPPLLQFDAALLAAREDLVLGRYDRGESAVNAALKLYPGARSARILLSALLQNAGDRAGAVDALAPLARSADASTSIDPWLTYDRHHAPSAAQMLSELYGLARGAR